MYRLLSFDNYLRLMQRGYFFAYRAGLLKRNPEYACHYYVRNLIKPGDVIIDIGANLGYYSIPFARWTGSTGKVLAVEPLTVYNKIFNEKAGKYPNITLYPYALGTEEKDVEMVSSPQVGYYRTGLPHVYDPERDGDRDTQEFKFTAKMMPPSLLFQDLKRIDYIKCDIEGFELIVLSEMKELIARHRPILQVEVWEENEAPLLKLFNEMGYGAYKVCQNQLVSYSKENTALQGDFIFLPK